MELLRLGKRLKSCIKLCESAISSDIYLGSSYNNLYHKSSLISAMFKSRRNYLNQRILPDDPEC